MTTRLADIRRARGLTLVDLASRSGVDSGALSRIEHGDIVGPKRAARIASALGAATEEVFPTLAGRRSTP